MALVGFAIAALFIGAGVAAARWLVTRAFGIRAPFREMVDTNAERGRPALALARAFASIAGMYLGCVLLFVPGFAGGRMKVDETSMRVSVIKDGPASRAGILAGDRIVEVNGEKVVSWDQLKKLVASHPNETLQVDVERGAERRTFSVTADGPKIMIAPFAEHESLSAGEVLAASFTAPYEVARAMVRGVVSPKPTELSGPVGVSKEVLAASREGPTTFFKVVAALASYQAAFIAVVLLGLAFFMGFAANAAKRTLPTSGNSS